MAGVKAVSATGVLALSILAILELAIFFNRPDHFFQGDTLFWLSNPYGSITEFFRGFFHLDPGGWYRPLTQRTVPSLLLPIFGLEPIPYRLVTFALFFLCTVLVFVLIERLTERWLPAAIGTFFFATHVTHAYTTYDVAFTPELLYTSFYILSAISWLSHLRDGRNSSAVASLLFFLGSLLSKEAAVTLPVVLTLLWLLDPMRGRAGVRWLTLHFTLLGVYLAFVVGYLGVGGIDIVRLLENPRRAGLSGGYELVLDGNFLESLKTSLRWVFGFPASVHGDWQLPAPWLSHFLHAFRFVLIFACLLSLIKGARRAVLIGLCWFLVSALPMLPLLDHFLPYYLMAPLVGAAIVVGVALTDVYERFSRFAPALAMTTGILLLTTFGAVHASTAWEVQRTQALLGGSSQNAASAVADLRAIHPKLPPGTILAFLNEGDPGVVWNHAEGGLFRMAYGDPTITVQYSANGFSIADSDVFSHRVRYLRIKDGRILAYQPYRVEFDSYTLRVRELAETELLVLYTLNGEARPVIRTSLDANGETKFGMTRETPPGVYSIVAVKRPEEPAWSMIPDSP